MILIDVKRAGSARDRNAESVESQTPSILRSPDTSGRRMGLTPFSKGGGNVR
jgi:hypothetical protein